jgi:hypothetical protein
MGFLPDWRSWCARAPWRCLIRLAFTCTSSVAGFHHHISKEMLLWKAEVQYVCRNAARQRTVDKFPAFAAIASFLLPSLSAANDLIFRRR